MSQQDNINFWNNRPCNIKHSNKQIGSLEYFNEVTHRKFIVEKHILEFADFSKYKDKNVLEVGCGIGTTAHKFIENGAKYTGIDISSESLNIAKQRFQIFNLDGKLIEADIEEWKSDETYDLIYSFGVLHHTENIQKAIANIKTLLKPNGEFKLMLYATNSWKNFCIQSGLDQFEAQSGCPIARTFTTNDVFKLLEGFSNIKIKQDHIFQYKIDKYKNYEYEKEDWFKAMPENLIKCLEDNLGWHLLIKCFKNNI